MYIGRWSVSPWQHACSDSSCIHSTMRRQSAARFQLIAPIGTLAVAILLHQYHLMPGRPERARIGHNLFRFLRGMQTNARLFLGPSLAMRQAKRAAWASTMDCSHLTTTFLQRRPSAVTPRAICSFFPYGVRRAGRERSSRLRGPKACAAGRGPSLPRAASCRNGEQPTCEAVC